MLDQSARALIPVLALALFGVEPARSWAQRTPSTSPTNPPAAAPRPSQGGQFLPALPRPVTTSKPPAAVDPSVQKSSQDLPSPAPLAVGLKPVPLESTDLRFPINLATALRLSDARPLIVAAAQASTWVAEAQLARAKVLWIPSLMFGADYLRHDGGGPDFNKGTLTSTSTNFFYGGGGMYANVNLTDVFFSPLAARRVLDSRHYDIQAAKNDALSQTADAYFGVHQYRGMYAGALYTVERSHELIERLKKQSKDLATGIEVDRARTLAADLEQQAMSAREEWRVHSANLTQVLRLDPRAVVEPLEEDHLQVTLIDPARPLDELLPIALANRPELGSIRALAQAAEVRVRQEKSRPLLPSIQINGFQSPNELIQAGIFGFGPNSSLNQWTGRMDLSYQVMWQAEGFGLGNLARIKQQRGEQSKAIIELRKTQDMVVADVTRSLARLQSATARVKQADRALRAGIITYNGNYEGLGQTTRFGDVLVLVYRPQEAIYSLRLMKVAFDEYFTTVAEYNRAEFQMFHALGYPAREITQLRTPGPVEPVDTNRPAFLPPVGTGPPPATR